MVSSVRRLYALALACFAAAAGFGLIALAHMRSLAAYGPICGGAVPHCPACPAALGSLAAGVALLALAQTAQRRPAMAVGRR